MVAYLQSGSEFKVGTTTVGKEDLRITALASGQYVVTWTERNVGGTSDDVRAQIYGADGTKVGGEFLVNTVTQNGQSDPDITALANGGFVVCWQDGSLVGGDPDLGIKGQVFSAAGAKVGAEFLANTTVTANQSQSRIAALNDGTFVIAWRDASATGGDTDGNAVRGQHFAANGSKLGSEILINAGTTTGGQDQVSIAGLAGGGFLAAWQDDTGADHVSFRRFDASGNPDGATTTIPGVTFAVSPNVIGLAGGGYVVGFEDTEGAKGQVFDAFNVLRDTVTFNTVAASGGEPVLAALPDGGFVAVWNDNTSNFDPSGGGILAAVFDAFGNRLETFRLGGAYSNAEFLVNSTTESIQFLEDVAVLPNGDFIVTFRDFSQDATFTAPSVRTQRFAAYQERIGGGTDNTMLGAGGRDFIAGFAGTDILKGNGGDDILDGGSKGDSLDGGGGIDAASYGTSASSVIADLLTPGNNSNDAVGDVYISIENLIGSKFGDKLSGNNGANVLDGGAGDDELIGRGGADALVGGLGSDAASYVFATLGVVADLRGIAAGTNEALGDTFVSIENLTGSGFGDTLIGDVLDNKLSGFGGNDILEGMNGADTLDGGLGNNTASYARALDDIIADLTTPANNNGDDAQGDTFASIQNLTGGAFNDTLRGDGNVNVLTGGKGNDLLEGRGGADKLDGGEGNDTASYLLSAAGVIVDLAAPGLNSGDAAGDTFFGIENVTGSDQADTLRGNAVANILLGGKGADNLNGGDGLDTASYASASALVTASLAAPGTNTGDATGDTYTTIENLIGSGFNDNLTGNGIANVINGGLGNDTLTGGGGADTLIGDSGNDTLFGEDGADTLNGSSGNDTLDGGKGNDILSGGSLIDILNGGDNDDTLSGGTGNDTLNGGLGNDTLNGDDDHDTLSGGFGIDKLDGGQGNDVLNGNEDNDNLKGGVGNDTLDGGLGADVLIGGLGNDALTGGGGADFFWFELSIDGSDTIADFTPVDDTLRIDASGFGGGLVGAPGPLPANRFVAGSTPAGNQAFGQFLYDTDDGRLFWDIDGSGVTVAVVLIATLTGAPVITTADFNIIA